jgi:hypothetical protein
VDDRVADVDLHDFELLDGVFQYFVLPPWSVGLRLPVAACMKAFVAFSRERKSCFG